MTISFFFGQPIEPNNSINLSDTKAEAVEYISNRRPILPAVYNMQKSGGRTAQQTESLSRYEYNSALSSGYTAMNHRFVIKTEKFCDEISGLRKRIVEYNLKNLGDEGLDDSDIEHLQDEIDDDSDSDVEFELFFPKPQSMVKLESNDEDDVDDTHQSDAPNDPLADKLTPNTAESNVSLTDDLLPNPIQSNASLNDDLPPNQIQSNASSAELASGSNDNSVGANNVDDALYGSLNCEKNEVDDVYFPEFDTTIRAPIVNVLRAWNSTHPFNSYFYDKKFLGVLLREVFSTRMRRFDEDLDEQGISFMKRLFEIRVNHDKVRSCNFNAIFKEKCQSAKEKIIRRRASHADQ